MNFVMWHDRSPGYSWQQKYKYKTSNIVMSRYTMLKEYYKDKQH